MEVLDLLLPAVALERASNDLEVMVVQHAAGPRLLERADLALQHGGPIRGQACRPDTIDREGLHNGTDTRSRQNHAQPTVPVRRPPDRLVEAAVAQEELPSYRGVPKDEIPLQNGAPLVLGFERPTFRVAASNDPSVRLQIRVGRENVQIGARAGEVGESLQTSRQIPIVGVENSEEIPAGESRGHVLRGALAAVLLARDRNPPAVRAEHALEVVG